MLVTLPLLKAGLTGSIAWSTMTDPQLVDLVEEAHGLLAAALGWEIVATHAVETQTGSGTATLFLRRYPVCAINGIVLLIPGVGSAPSSFNVYNPAYSITRWDTGQIDNYSAFAIQLAGSYAFFPRGTPVQVDYVYGYPMAQLSNSPAQGGTSVQVDTPLGFRVGEDYRIEDGANTETFTVSAIAGSTLTTTAGLLHAHSATSQANGALAVTNMPREVVRVTRRIVERRLLGRTSPALQGVKGRYAKQGDITESFVEVAELTPQELALLAPNLSRLSGGFA